MKIPLLLTNIELSSTVTLAFSAAICKLVGITDSTILEKISCTIWKIEKHNFNNTNYQEVHEKLKKKQIQTVEVKISLKMMTENQSRL